MISNNGKNCYLEAAGFSMGLGVKYYDRNYDENGNYNDTIKVGSFYMVDSDFSGNLTPQQLPLSAYVYDKVKFYVIYKLPLNRKSIYSIDLTVVPSSVKQIFYMVRDAESLNTDEPFIPRILRNEMEKVQTCNLNNGTATIKFENISSNKEFVAWSEITLSQYLAGASISADIYVEIMEDVIGGLFIYDQESNIIEQTVMNVTYTTNPLEFGEIYISKTPDNFETLLLDISNNENIITEAMYQALIVNLLTESQEVLDGTGVFEWTNTDIETNASYIVWGMYALDTDDSPQIIINEVKGFTPTVFVYDIESTAVPNQNITIKYTKSPSDIDFGIVRASIILNSWTGFEDSLPSSGESYINDQTRNLLLSTAADKRTGDVTNYSASDNQITWTENNNEFYGTNITNKYLLWTEINPDVLLGNIPSLDITSISAEAEDDADPCLSGDTLITMADYSTKPLEDLTLNDIVLGKNGPVKVKHLAKNAREGFHTFYYFDNGTIINEVEAHPFYSVEADFYKSLNQWDIGEHALDQSNNEIALINKKEMYDKIPRFGLWTEDGTYYANGLLSGDYIHNRDYLADASLDKMVTMMQTLQQDLLFDLLTTGEKGEWI